MKLQRIRITIEAIDDRYRVDYGAATELSPEEIVKNTYPFQQIIIDEAIRFRKRVETLQNGK